MSYLTYVISNQQGNNSVEAFGGFTIKAGGLI